MSSITEQQQALESDAIVSLYTIDTRPIGRDEVYNFTTRPFEDESAVVFNGVAFAPIDIEAVGFKWDGKGGFPKPKLRISNVGGLVSSLVVGVGDIVGARVTRIRTYVQHLDGGDFPDPEAMFPPEIYIVNQRTKHNKQLVEWELSSTLDQLGVKIPRRQCVRDTCTHRYRIWNEVTESFDYSNATCPYVGDALFTTNGDTTEDPTEESCGRSIADCKLRFGENGVLPTRAFPGISRSGA